MTMSSNRMDLAEFGAMVETFGGDRTRWPSSMTAAAEALLATSAEARRLEAEAMALDRLLGRASQEVHVGGDDLVRRILAEAGVAGSGRNGAAADNVVPFPTRKPTEREAAPVARAAPGRRFAQWQAAAVLALALLTGVGVGALDVMQGPVGSLTSIVGLEADPGATTAALHIDVMTALGDEEQL